ncbi:ABC transporter substrate-binding protein [Escherichia coli]|uniref:ABC transporter substrate-binding protein n=1 Tax=Escherichia coli TaxID=562 RepID=UPI000CFD7833|nr:ABC transporter substrate-binding protein [Escherichia coli]
MIVRILLLFIALFTFGAQAQAIKESYAFAVLGEPRYAFNFNHFDYVNPAAPKGGQITLSALGTFDNFNRYALRGNPGARTEQLYDTLFTTSDDEPGSYYPLIAESARYADDYSWVEVAINPRARFHDGSPITARDVEFTFQKFMTEGVPQFRLVYKGTTVKAIAPLTVRIELPASSNSQWVLPFQHSLQRLGINMDIRKVDNSQITNRMRSRDYDMMPRVWRAMPWPSSDLQISWSSEYINSTYNAPGVQSPVIDSLINQIIAAQGNKEKLLPLGRALDRVLTWNYYMLPMWYMAEDRLAWWDKFSQPAVRPVYSLGIDTWWYDVNKATKLPSARQQGE